MVGDLFGVEKKGEDQTRRSPVHHHTTTLNILHRLHSSICLSGSRISTFSLIPTATSHHLVTEPVLTCPGQS